MGRLAARLALVAAAALAPAAFAARADAAAIQSYTYTSSGSIDGTPGSGYPIRVDPQDAQTLTTPGTSALGTFVTSPLPPGATLTYDNTAFRFLLTVGPYAATPGVPFGPTAGYAYQILGTLNGSLKGDGTSTLFPTITSVTVANPNGFPPPFAPADLRFDLQGIAAPNGANDGSTVLTARVDVTGSPLPSPAPEPTSVAAFVAALAGWTWSRRRGRTRPTTP